MDAFNDLQLCSKVHPSRLQQCSGVLGDKFRRAVLKLCRKFKLQDLTDIEKGEAYACAHCHIEDEKGRCERTSLAGK